MAMMDLCCRMEDPVLKHRGTVGIITPNVFTGCSSSDDGDSIRSDGTNQYVPVLGCFPVNRRQRKMLKPRRAAMYGSEVGGVWCDGADESQCHKPRPVKQPIELPHSPLITSRRVSAPLKPIPVPAANKSTRPPSSAAAQCSKKSCSPVCGPCGNCGTVTSPQWRRGNDEKPIVCNACGIRYLRSGSFEKSMRAEKKRTASGGSGAVSGGIPRVKRCKTDIQPTSSVDTYLANNSPEAVRRPAKRATTDNRKRRSSPTDTVVSNAASPSASPAVTSLAADTASTPTSPLRLDGPCANNAAGSSAYAANYHTHAEQQHVPTPRGRRSQSDSRLGPSPLGRVSMPDEPPANDVPAPGQPTTYPALAALVPVGQMSSGTSPFAAPMATFPSTAAAAGPVNSTAAGTAAAQAVGQAELLHLLSILAPRMGSFDAAIAYLMASAGVTATSGTVVPVAGVPGQVPARMQW